MAVSSAVKHNYAKFYEEPKWLIKLNKGKWDANTTKPIFRPGVIQIGDDQRSVKQN